MPDEIHFPHTMRNADALMLRVESDPTMRSTTAAVTLLDRAPDRDRLTARMRQAAVDIPRLRQRVVELPRALSNPVWAWDPYFDLVYHLRWIGAPRDGSQEALLELAASFSMQGFDKSRPLWEFIVVEGLPDGRAALIQKLHHAVTDGVGGMLLMQRVYDDDCDLEVPDPVEMTPPPAEGRLELGLHALLRNLAARPAAARDLARRWLDFGRHPLDSTQRTLATLQALAHHLTPALEPLSPVLRGRSSRYRFGAFCISLPSLKAAAHAARGKLNDAFLAGLAGGWRLYHERHGAPVDELRATIPLNLRGAGPAIAGNQLSLAHVLVPIAEEDPGRRIRVIRERVASERAQPSLDYLEGLAGVLNWVPSALLSLLSGVMTKGVDFVASSVPGPPQSLYVAGARVEALYPFGPTVGTAANATLFSQGERADIAFNVDPQALPDLEVLLECMREGFDEVLKLG